MIPWKLSGAGNTFVVEILEAHNPLPTQNQAREFCDINHVDGYLALTQADPALGVFHWAFFNRDGSEAEFCGNAARCAQYFVNAHLKIQKAEHKTKSGLVKTWTENDQHWVQMPKSEIFQENIKLQVDGQTLEGFWCDTGVPHLVIFLQNTTPDKSLSEKLRFHPDLGSRGANVTWVQGSIKSNPIQAVTYERGVEDFTQACGTGALAAALAVKAQLPQQEEFSIMMPGGLLRLKKDSTNWIMTGPVVKLGEWQGSKNV